jgi:MFS family permease
MKSYGALLGDWRFLAFWGGFTISVAGDATTRVALTWHVLSETGSPEAIGVLGALFTAPVLVGGLLAGWLLDRFDRRRILIIDAVVRAVAVASLPAVDLLGLGDLGLGGLGFGGLWHAYAIAAIHGLAMMIPLAGVPSILPTMVRGEHLSAANALEVLSYTASGAVGAMAAGFLIPVAGREAVIAAAGATILVVAATGAMVTPLRDARASRL